MVSSKPTRAKPRFPPNRIRELREERGLTQGELGAAIGLTYAQLGRIENSVSRLKREYLQPLATKLGVDTWDLLGHSPEKKQIAAFAVAQQLTDEQFDWWIEQGKVYLRPGRSPGLAEAATPFVAQPTVKKRR